jgi:hypothetical protein
VGRVFQQPVLSFRAIPDPAFRNSDAAQSLFRLKGRMKRSPFLAFVLLSAVFSFGRTFSDEEIARAVLRAVRSHPGMPNPDSVQVSHVVVTSEGVCMEYRVGGPSGGIHEGYAVYKTDRDLVYIDNSWIWDSSCLVGKYGQRRNGKDVTQNVSAALEAKKKGSAAAVASAQVASVQAAPAVPIVAVPAAQVAAPPAPPVQSPVIVAPVVSAAPATQAATVSLPVEVRVPTAPVQPAAAPQEQAASVPAAPIVPSVAAPVPVPSAPPVIGVAPSKPVDVRAAAVPAPVVAVTLPPVVIVQAAPPVAAAAPAVVAVAPTPVATQAAVVPVETGTVRGVTIADPYGALGKATPTAPGAVVQESLADAARRLKKAKQ